MISSTKNHGLALLGGLICSVLSGAPVVMADDTELFVTYAGNAAPPNILFIIDTSGSMGGAVESQAAYDPNTVYTGSCAADRVYWSIGVDDTPSCDTERWIEDAALECAAAREAFASGAGRLTDRFVQFGVAESRWRAPSPSDHTGTVECEDDRGRHGDGSSATHVYATDGNADARWSQNPADEISWAGHDSHTFFSANYLNWYYGPPITTTRMQVVKDVASGLAGSINGVNIGLMRFNSDQGGRLVHPVLDVATHRESLDAAIQGLTPSGVTPMAETLYEAALYFLGLPPHFGGADVGVGANGHYQSPVAQACQKNYIVYLTDGEPSSDTEAATLAPSLPSFGSLAGTCSGSGDGTCLPELARYLHEVDLAPQLEGKQNVVTYTIGFALDLPLLSTTAAQGGGQYYVANDTQSLSRALTNIVTSILETQATFTAPAVSVNSFNRTQHLNDLFITVFQPTANLHWPGNLKKYRLRAEDATIIDANDRPAVDETGFFSPDSHSFWSAEPDGRRVTQGGAASRLPSPATRRVFTYLPELGNPLLVASGNAVRADNGLLTAARLGVDTSEQRDRVIRFMRGEDINDSDLDGSRTDARHQIGDPLHSQPAALVYGGTPGAPDLDDAVVFFATNDGYLHAIDAATGVEKWAFVPPEFLADQARLLENPASGTKHYGIDGNLRLQVLTNDHDGIVDPSSGEKVYLFFGMRRGGHAYYALDVTNPDAPSLLWRVDGSDLPGLGQTWSSPVPTQIKVGTTKRNVVIFAGGYDTSQDVANDVPGPDGLGNAIYILDSETGQVIWRGGNTNDATRRFDDMRYSMPADLKVIDLDSDGFADRIYGADMGGQVWRFDVFNGEPASSLVTGGVIARLGSAGLGSPTLADARRFYYAPDVALATTREGTFLHIGIGSGFRSHPNQTSIEDRFYALRDYEPFRHRTQAEFDSLTPITEGDLTDITSSPNAVVGHGSRGWMLRLRTGEKVLAEARTFHNDVYFTTFTPGAIDPNSCEPRLGTNRLYILSLFDGTPVNNLDGSFDDEELTIADRAMEFRGSIASEVSFLFPSVANPDSCVGDECRPLPVVCVDLFCFPTTFGNNPIRTFWRQESVD